MFSIKQMTRCRAIVAAAVMAYLLPVAAAAETALQPPQGEVILTVSGSIAQTNAGGDAGFNREMLLALPQHEIRTTTEWTDGVKQFSGPLLSDVLAAVGASGEAAAATALNDYTVEIPLQDFTDYPVILAMSMDGAPLTLRTKGPLWIVYPRDQHSELQNPEMNSRWIWQLRALEIR